MRLNMMKTRRQFMRMIDCPKTGLAENTFDAFLSLNSLKRLQYIELPLKWFQMSSKVYVCFMNE